MRAACPNYGTLNWVVRRVWNAPGQKHNPMKTVTPNSKCIASKIDDHDKSLKEYDLKLGILNFRTLCQVGITAQLKDALTKYMAHITD